MRKLKTAEEACIEDREHVTAADLDACRIGVLRSLYRLYIGGRPRFVSRLTRAEMTPKIVATLDSTGRERLAIRAHMARQEMGS